jgi:hypothetical protein
MGVVDEGDLRQQLGSVLDAVTPSDPPVRGTVRRGKILQAGRSIGIVTGLAVVAGIGVGAPGLLRAPVSQPASPARPTVEVERACSETRQGLSQPASQPELVVTPAGQLPAAQLAAGSCAWLKP